MNIPSPLPEDDLVLMEMRRVLILVDACHTLLRNESSLPTRVICADMLSTAEQSIARVEALLEPTEVMEL